MLSTDLGLEVGLVIFLLVALAFDLDVDAFFVILFRLVAGEGFLV